jgi:hypothetical protein
MGEDGTEPLWRARLRWRRRGAWQGPAFAVLTLADALLLGRLPIAGERTGLVAGLLLAMFFNLVAVAVVAPPLALLLGRRRPDLPAVVAGDRVGTALLLVVTAGLLAGGLAHRPARLAADRAFAAQSAAVRRYVRARAAPAYRATLSAADTRRHAGNLFRTCLPGTGRPPAELPLCLLVDTAVTPPRVTVDPDHTPNRGP